MPPTPGSRTGPTPRPTPRTTAPGPAAPPIGPRTGLTRIGSIRTAFTGFSAGPGTTAGAGAGAAGAASPASAIIGRPSPTGAPATGTAAAGSGRRSVPCGSRVSVAARSTLDRLGSIVAIGRLAAPGSVRTTSWPPRSTSRTSTARGARSTSAPCTGSTIGPSTSNASPGPAAACSAERVAMPSSTSAVLVTARVRNSTWAPASTAARTLSAASAESRRAASTCTWPTMPTLARSPRAASRSPRAGSAVPASAAARSAIRSTDSRANTAGRPRAARSPAPRRSASGTPASAGRANRVASTRSSPAAIVATRPARSAGAATPTRRATRATARPAGASARRRPASSTASGREEACTAAVMLSDAIGVRAAIGATSPSSRASGIGCTCLRWNAWAAQVVRAARCSAASAARTSPTCCQAALTMSSWFSRTTSAPRPPATRARGSRFTSRNQSASSSRTCQRRTCAEPSTGGPTGWREASSSTWPSSTPSAASARVRVTSCRPSASVAGTSARRPSEPAGARRAPSMSSTWSSAAASRSGGAASPTYIGTMPTCSDALCGRIRRARDSKSPSGPVWNSQWW